MLDIPAYLPGGKAGDNWKAILDVICIQNSRTMTCDVVSLISGRLTVGPNSNFWTDTIKSSTWWCVSLLLASSTDALSSSLMQTAADGAAEFYTTENNAARTETAEQARELDSKMIDCWGGHANLKVMYACQQSVEMCVLELYFAGGEEHRRLRREAGCNLWTCAWPYKQ